MFLYREALRTFLYTYKHGLGTKYGISSISLYLFGISDERGVTNEFAGNLSDWCTAHEHAQYIGLLDNISKFAKM